METIIPSQSGSLPFSCPVCGSPECPIHYTHPVPFARCKGCGLLFRADREAITQPNLAYERHEGASRAAQLVEEETARRAYTRSRAERIHRCAEPHGSLLEIGAGTGSLLAEFKRLGWEIEGIEPAPVLQAHAASQLGEAVVHRCEVSGAEEVLRFKPYQVIVALDVIEHLPDPFLLARKAFDWLSPGGYLFLQTPNVDSLRHRLEASDWEQLAPGEHCILHSARSLRTVIERSSFIVEELRTLSGGATDRPFRRMWMWPVETGLNLLGVGNALWAVTRKGHA